VASRFLLLLVGSMAVTMAVALSQGDPLSKHASFTSFTMLLWKAVTNSVSSMLSEPAFSATTTVNREG